MTSRDWWSVAGAVAASVAIGVVGGIAYRFKPAPPITPKTLNAYLNKQARSNSGALDTKYGKADCTAFYPLSDGKTLIVRCILR